MFTPEINLDVVYRCGYFRLKDETGPDTGDATKWDGVAGLDSSTITEAIITIVSPSGTSSDVTVTSTITGASPITGDVDLGDHAGTYPDGLYSLVYKLKTTDINITAFADYSVTVPGTIKCTSVAHGLTTGEYAIIVGSTYYDGTYLITKIDADNFYILGTYTYATTATATKYYVTTFYPYVYCRLEGRRDRMYASISRMAPGDTRDAWIKDADRVSALLMVIKSAISSANLTALANLQAEANQILNFYDIDSTF